MRRSAPLFRSPDNGLFGSLCPVLFVLLLLGENSPRELSIPLPKSHISAAVRTLFRGRKRFSSEMSALRILFLLSLRLSLLASTDAQKRLLPQVTKETSAAYSDAFYLLFYSFFARPGPK